MLSYVHGASSVPLLGETIGANLERTARRLPDADALVCCHQAVRWSYRELDERVDALARGLVAAGLQVGDRVGIWSPSCAEWVLVQFATAKAGVVLVTVNPAYRATELAYALRQSACRMLVAARSFKESDYAAMIEEVRGELPDLERMVLFESPEWERLAAGEQASEGELRARTEALQFDDPINIQYTSGTTGFPKGATLSHHNILNNGYFVAKICGYTEADRVCIPVPFYHCFGMVVGNLACMTHGACIVVPGPSFEARRVLEAVANERCTSLYGVPTMFIAELAEPDFASFDLSSLRTGIMAGSPCPAKVMKRVIAEMHMEQVTICYGMTETSPVSTQSDPADELERRVGTVGSVHPHVEIKLIDQLTGRTVRRGEQGELCTRGYSVMLGYWRQPAQTAEAIDPAGWMHTGDLATMDDAGYVQIVGRSKDLIIRGGENVYPREIEDFLHTHPGVSDVQVVGIPDERYGEAVVAFVCREAGAQLDADALREHCRAIAHYKVPRDVHFVAEFPMTVSGKVQKFKLREWAIAELRRE
jgi:fatty-acyl-CoA synthase